MKYRVRLSQTARRDLEAIVEWVEVAAGRTVADAYEARVMVAIGKLVDFPRRGAEQDHIAPGMRTLSFERRLRIAYRVQDGRVDIVRIFAAARDLREIAFD